MSIRFSGFNRCSLRLIVTGAKSETFAQLTQQIYSLTRTLRRAGEFNISNLTNDNGFPLGYCDGTKIVEKRFNVTIGIFTAIP